MDGVTRGQAMTPLELQARCANAEEQLQATHGQVAQMVRFLEPTNSCPDAWTLRDLIVAERARAEKAERERDEARARIAALEQACDAFEKNSATCAEEFEGRLRAERERDALRDQLRVARGALKRLGDHDWRTCGQLLTGACTCGLDAALAATEEKP